MKAQPNPMSSRSPFVRRFVSGKEREVFHLSRPGDVL